MQGDAGLADFEKLGAFYLGRNVTPKPGETYLYDAKHLTTHGVVIGMTGSGKTGLSIALLEEAAIDGIPAIVVDPKGDLGNLMLTFPRLSPEEFQPWVPHGSDAETEARQWTEGLAGWGQDAARISRLRAAAEVAVYTPGSRAGQPLSILGSLAAPPPELRDDSELISERITQVATSLLGLVGIDAEPGKSREHVLVANILQRAWEAGEDLDLAGLVMRIQEPPFDRVGVLDLQAFYPKKERFELAVAYNALLAAPGFDAWLDGPPLDIASLLWTKEGKPRVAILSIAHLGDAERMFFVSLLLGQLVSWMRAQPGTPSLRALFFMDECVGFFPPVAMPPSKRPLLLLLKQARAFGLGIVLATQNPVDLDYKGLSNAGTWFIGRLQTERDKARVLDGLEGVSSSGSATSFDRDSVDKMLSGLAKRHFYIHDVHADGPVVVESRWTMSYLRGPLTRDEIKRLAKAKTPKAPPPAAKPQASADAPVNGNDTILMPAMAAPPASPPAKAAPPASPPAKAAERPVVPSGVPEVFLPTTLPSPMYRPMVLGAARVHFEDAKTGLDYAREVAFLTPVSDGPLPVRWEDAKWAGGLDVRALSNKPAAGARFGEPPATALVAKSYAAWSKELSKWLARTQGVARMKVGGEKIFSLPTEDERTFRARLAQLGRESRDEAVAAVREKYAAKMATLEDKIRRKQDAVSRGSEQASARRMDAAVAAGGGLLGSFLGGGAKRALSKAASAAKSADRAARHDRTVAKDRDDLAELMSKHRELQHEAQAVVAQIAAESDPATLPLESVVTKPKKTGITVHLVALAWVPEPAPPG